jgi:hypothetical protein
MKQMTLESLTDLELNDLNDWFNSLTKRQQDVVINGYSTKFAYHVVRLLNEVEQILIEHTLDLTRNNEQLKAIRRGEWSLDQLKQYFQDKERTLEKVYSESTLQHKPNEEKIKNLLLECLEMHYGNIDSAIKRDVNVSDVINEIEKVLERFKS